MAPSRWLSSTPAAALIAWTLAANAAPRPGAISPSDPRLVLGLSSVDAGTCSLAAAAGFTIVHSIEFASFAEDAPRFIARAQSYLDEAQRARVRVLLSVPSAWRRDRKRDDIQTVVRTLRDHPALLAWYDACPPAGDHTDRLRDLDRIIQKEDPLHGLVLGVDLVDKALNGVGRARTFSYFPVTSDSRHSQRLQSASERFELDDLDVPVWPLLQAFGAPAETGGLHERLAPTPGEVEATMCSALIAGARGVFLVQQDPQVLEALAGDPQAAAISPLLPSVLGGHAALATRLLDHLTGADPSEALRIARAPRGVEVGRWDTGGGILVIVANLSRTTANVELACDTAAGSIEWVTTPERGVQRDGTRLTLLTPATSGIAFIVKPAAP